MHRTAHVLLILACLAFGLLAPGARGVVIATGDGTGNTEAPPDDPGFAYVGNVGVSVVYLRNGWVISANHVEPHAVRLQGKLHRYIEGSKRRVRNRDEIFRPDLAVFKIHPRPTLPPLAIRTSPPTAGDPVVLIGRGRNRGAPLEWNGFAGWEWLAKRTMRWGTNLVEETGVDVSITGNDLTHAFTTRFDPPPATEHEAQVANGDSGGGAFIKNGERWELAGVLFGASGHAGQPEASTLFGNKTLIADLSRYREEIFTLTAAPACSDGFDDDLDGLIDHPADPGCASPADETENDRALPCDDGRDNDADLGIDYPYDFGCDSPTDPTEG